MKKHIINTLLAAAFIGCVCWAAKAPGLQAWIPLILAIILGIALLNVNTNYIKEA